MIKPNLIKIQDKVFANRKLVSEETSKKINNILRKVVTDEKGLQV